MDRKLIDYLPPVLREVEDFKSINGANEPEIALAWDAAAMVLANQFLETADARGVSVWERELKLHPKDTDTMELRKVRIKAMWNLEVPYTMPWLKSWLTGIFGADRHEERVEDYALTIQVKQDLSEEMRGKTDELFEMLAAIIPENIWMVLEKVFPQVSTAVPLTPIPGPRYSRVELPPVRRTPPVGRISVTPVRGIISSVTVLPMAAGREGG